MAKETAHQLGTPISFMAWTELMKSKFDAEDDPLIAEMENDIKRLEIITDRFSKIGSKPIFEDHTVYIVITILSAILKYVPQIRLNSVLPEMSR